MELKEFIKIAIRDITDAIHESQNELTNGAVISPVMNKTENKEQIKNDSGNGVRTVSYVEFEVAVSAGERSGVSAGAKGFISVISAHIGGNVETKSDNVSKVKFSIPVAYPYPHQ